MCYGIYDINTSNNLSYQQRFDIYKKVGFEYVGFYIDNNYMKENETYDELISYAKNIGLKINQVHVCYKLSNDICENCENYIKYMTEKLKVCKKYNIKNMVLHASKGDSPPIINSKQLQRVENLAKSFNSINLAFENVRNNCNLEQILKLQQKNITFCFDLGHAHAYSSLHLLDKFDYKISCSHLHNNFGSDSHNLLSNGEIDFKPIVKKLKDLKTIPYLEVYPERTLCLDKHEFENFVRQAYDDLNF